MFGIDRLDSTKRGKALYRICMALMILLLCFLVFFKLDVKKSEYDEARHGISAYEMLKTGDFLVTTYQYEPDYWNLKPMLSEYLIALGYTLFGFNMIGLRFFSAFLWVALALLYSRWAYKRCGKVAAGAVLFLSAGAYRILLWHAVRVGNADSLHIFLSGVCLLSLLEYEGRRDGYLYLACLCFALDFLAKSYHAGVMALEIIVFVLLFDRGIFRQPKKIVFCLLSALGPVLLWGILRYLRDGTEFLSRMYNVDVNERSTSVLDSRAVGALFYFTQTLADTLCLSAIVTVVLLALLSGRNAVKKKPAAVCLIFILTPLILFTLVVTKRSWYIYTYYPAFILAGACAAQALFDLEAPRKKRLLALALPALLALSAVCVSMVNAFSVQSDEIKDELYASRAQYAAFRGRNVYMNGTGRDGQVGQVETLMLELGGDLVPRRGSTQAWLSDENGLLLLLTGEDTSIEAPFEYVFRGEKYTILKHPSNPPFTDERSAT